MRQRWLPSNLYLRIVLAMILSITIVLAVLTAWIVSNSQVRLKDEMLMQGQTQLKILTHAASVYFAQQDAHQLILTGMAATESGQPQFVAFYSVTGNLLAAAAAPNAPDTARVAFGDLPLQAHMSGDTQTRWMNDYLEIAQPIIYQGQPSGMVALRLGTEELQETFKRELLQNIVTALVLVVVLNLVVGLLLWQFMIVPLRRLSVASDQIGAGVWVDPPGQERSDEFGTLARSFGHMVQALRAREIQLQEQIVTIQSLNTELDARVIARTIDLQQSNQELIAARQVAEEANRLKSQFLANMSHELRTPLNAILNFTKFLSKERYGTLTTRQLDLQQRVLSNAEHLLGLINDILDLAKIESGHIDLLREDVDLVRVLQGVMATAVGLTKDKGLTLTLETPDELPLIHVDKIRIRQVLLNLLSNAAKFTEQGGIIVRALLTDDQMIRIEVADTGIGIDPHHQAMVFEEFRQVQNDLQREYQGTGLGLPISHRLVELHGGHMGVESTPGQGSIFYFTLPIVETIPASQPSIWVRTMNGSEPNE